MAFQFQILLIASHPIFGREYPPTGSTPNQISSKPTLSFSLPFPTLVFLEPWNPINRLPCFIPTAFLSSLRVRQCFSWSFAPKSKCRTLLSKLVRMKTFVPWHIIYISSFFSSSSSNASSTEGNVITPVLIFAASVLCMYLFWVGKPPILWRRDWK